MPLIDNPRYAQMKQDAEYYERVTGEQAFLYPSQPGGGEEARFVFAQGVRLGIKAACTYASGLRRMAWDREQQESAARRAAENAEEMKEFGQ